MEAQVGEPHKCARCRLFQQRRGASHMRAELGCLLSFFMSDSNTCVGIHTQIVVLLMMPQGV
eukprot:6177772-Amphidinium_carterae.1